ncbi:MAG: M42 family peptidase [Oscillospiraceae bacterium]|nr:M42 family peptidase [Oscillospiraceae bacterium]
MNLAELTIALCTAAGPAGFEEAAAEVIKREIAPFVDEVKTDVMGNVIAVKRCGKENAPSILLDAHMDEIGLMVTGYVEGHLRFNTIGGVDPRMLPAREIKVMSEEPLYGVISVMPPHALSSGDMSKALGIDDLFIDVGLSDDEAKEKVPVGTPCVYADSAFRLGDGSICGKSLDDRSCAAIIIKTMEELSTKATDVDIYCLFSVQEEIGLRGAITGAFGAEPDYAIILDVTFGKTPDVAAHKCLKMGGGPAIGVGPNTNRAFTKKIIDKAVEKGIDYQLEVLPGNSGTNAWVIQTSRTGVATALVSLPLKYMHSPVETMLVSDGEKIVNLLVEFLSDAGEVL